jgi:hypothetical protein
MVEDSVIPRFQSYPYIREPNDITSRRNYVPSPKISYMKENTQRTKNRRLRARKYTDAPPKLVPGAPDTQNNTQAPLGVFHVPSECQISPVILKKAQPGG